LSSAIVVWTILLKLLTLNDLIFPLQSILLKACDLRGSGEMIARGIRAINGLSIAEENYAGE